MGDAMSAPRQERRKIASLTAAHGGQTGNAVRGGQSRPSRLRKKRVRRRVSSASTPFENGPVRGGTARRAPPGFVSTPPSPAGWSCRLRRQVTDPDQVVDGPAEDEHPADALRSPMPRFAEHAGRLEPAEDLLDELS